MTEPLHPGVSVLVAYATRYGATRGVAERIAARLREAGHRVEVRQAGQAQDLGSTDAVVLGSGVFDGRWLPDLDGFIDRNADALRERPVWLFSVATFGDRKPLAGPLMRREPANIGDLTAAIRPRGYRVFAGVIERGHWPLPARLLYHAFGGRLGDHRDWADIDGWAQEVARELRADPSSGTGAAPAGSAGSTP
jgi:menaquinone-dependent protoporphyrinogen oxidase